MEISGEFADQVLLSDDFAESSVTRQRM